MSKYIDVDKLNAEIERLKSILADSLCSQGNILGPDWVAGGNKMLKEISSAITSLQQEQPKPFSCGHENGSEPELEGIEAVVHHYATVHYLETNTEQLNARLKQFDEGSKVLVYIEARKED